MRRIAAFALLSASVVMLGGCGVHLVPANTGKPTATGTAAAATLPTPVPSATPPAMPSTISAIDVSFINSRQGWLLGRVKRTGEPLILTSADGGQSWQQLAAPVVTLVSHILFVDRQNGFLYGPILYSTHDGGRTWSDDHPPPSLDVLQIVVVGRSVSAIEGSCGSGATRGICASRLMVSSDEGRTWQPAANQPPVPPEAVLVAPGTSEAWLFSGGFRSAGLVHTADAGEHWDVLGVPPCTGRWPKGFAAGRLWCVVNGSAGAGAQFRAVYVSDDGGLTWQVVLPPDQLRPGYVDILVAVTRDRAFFGAGGPATRMLQSDDGGRNWHDVNLGFLHGSGLAAIQFFDSFHGWAVENDVAYSTGATIVWRTTDGGTTWTPVQLP